MRAWQDARTDGDGTHRTRIATVNARLTIEDLTAHDLRFECKADFLDCVGIRATLAACTNLGKYAFPDIVYGLGTSLFLL